VLCTTVGCLTLTAGCAEPDPEPTSVITPVSTSDAEEVQAAGEAAETALRDYFRVHAQCLADPPSTEPSCFDQVSIDQVLRENHETLASAQDRRFHYVGERVVESVEVGNVDLESIARVEVIACIDWTDFQALNPDGTLFLPRAEGQPTRGQMKYEVRNYAYPSATRWRVGQRLNPEVHTPC
jgi:hypothetical protein